MTEAHTISPRPYGLHARQILALGLPLIGSQVAQFALHMTDVVMMGWYGLDELAALVLGSGYWFIIFILLAGPAFAVMPLVATALGEGESRTIRRATRMALWISAMAAVLFYPLFLMSERVLIAFGQEPHIAALAAPYLRITGVEMLPSLIVAVFRSYFSALERTRVVLLLVLSAVVLNAFLNWVFIFGNLGAPELGVTGAAVASLSVGVTMVCAMVLYARWATPEHEIFRNLHMPDWAMFRAVLRMGVPIGLTSLAEVGLFNAAALMMGWISTTALAAHGIALQIAGLTFMVQIGLSQAGTIRVGNALGRQDGPDLRRGALVVSLMSAGMACCTMAIFILFPEPLLGLFMSPNEPARGEVLALGVGLMFLGGLMQLSDGGQVVSLSLLRGLHDTAVPMWLASVSYWLIGLPASYLLGFTFGFGAYGVWIGFIVGLSAAWLSMAYRFWVRKARAI